jgi:tetratricopeptide (TPR) repeat protein
MSKDDVDPMYVFRHNLLKDAAYSILPLRKRKEIHRLVATLLEELYSGQISDVYENIGHHNLLCENFRKAAHYLKLAGDKAKNLYALEQAVNFYNTVLKIGRDTEDQVSSDTVRHVLLNLADVYEITADIPKMERVAQQGLESAQIENDLEKEVCFMERYAYALFLNNDFEKAEELLLHGVEMCTDSMSEILSVLYSDLGQLYQQKYEYEKSVLQYNMSWNAARAYEIKKGEIVCLYNLAQLHRDLGNYEQALEYLEYALNHLIRTDDTRWSSQFKYLAADIKYLVWNLEEAQTIFFESYKLSGDVGNVETNIRSALGLAVIAVQNGDAKKANEYLQSVDEKVTFLIREELLADINLKKAIVHYNRSDIKRTRDFITSALKIAQRLDLKQIEHECYCISSLIDKKHALEHAQKALDIAEKLKLPPLIAASLFRITQLYIEEQNSEKLHYYAQKALLMFDSIKFKLHDGHRKTYVRRPEYVRLLEI